MRRWIIVILSAMTIYVVADTIGHLNEAAHKGQRYEGIVITVCAWFVFWMFDRVRAIEQRKRDRNPQKYSVPAATQKRDRLSTTTASVPGPLIPAAPFSLKQFVSYIRDSLILSLVILFLNVGVTGDYFLACVFCSIWFFVALVRESVGHSSLIVMWARILIPVVTGILVYANFVVQEKISLSNAAIIIQACEHYHSDNGAYPEKLTDLVPHYLSSIPRAKYSLGSDKFTYNGSDQAFLMYWKQFGWPRFYDLRKRYWFGHSMAQ
jgi:hypothetical protein